MGLLVGGLLDFHLGGGFVDFPFELIAGALELPETLTDAPREFGKFFGAEKEQHDHENENNFGPARHGEGKEWSAHGSCH